ncbi:hypothetical protein AB0B89_36135 [Sphaerisporangium sp. NPDC049002]|uniref:hypothetical protein n=1 Tax=Sphaerisporangium sp. NPDC049002 TaxID=3155392 RepID=UPI0033CCDE0F
MNGQALADAVASHLTPIARSLGVTGISAHGDNAKIRIGPGREIMVINTLGDSNYPQDDRGDGEGQHLLVVWDRRRGNDWTITATSYNAGHSTIRMQDMATAVAAIIQQADHAPLSRAEAAALTGTPWFVRLARSLQRGDDQ